MRNTLLLVSLATGLLSTQSVGAEEELAHHIIVTTNQRQIGEACPELKAGQVLQFEFKAKQTVEFNLHYHQGDKVSYPIERQELKTLSQNYKAPIDQTYCLMWEGLEDDTLVQVKYSIKDQTGIE